MSRPYADESVYRAVAHPARRRMLDLLRIRERPVGELGESLRMAKQTLTHHLRVLRTSGLIRQRRIGRHRMYGIDAGHLRDMHLWLAPYQSLWVSKRTRS